MLRKKGVLTTVTTVASAFAIGFVMQSTEEAQLRYGPKPTIVTAEARPNPQADRSDTSLLDVQDITLTSAALVPRFEFPKSVVPTETIQASFRVDHEPEKLEHVLPSDCEINAVTRTVPAAMVDLTLTAPCLPNERVTVHHNGMMFTETTSNDGRLSLQIPALSEEAVFIVAFSSGEGAVVTTQVTEVANYDRAVLQWKGDAGFEIHAREFGANYGETGHRWAGSPGDLSSVVEGVSGVLTRHGNKAGADPLLAEVYTFPRASNGRTGDVVLSVEARVTAENCGLEVEAQSLEMHPAGQVRTRNVILPVPSCDSIGSFLVLNNLLQNLKVVVLPPATKRSKSAACSWDLMVSFTVSRRSMVN